MSTEKNAFLLAAISDTQEIIRQIDTKTELAMTVLLLATGVNASRISTLNGFDLIVPSVALLLAVCSAVIAYRTIVPKSNPKDSIVKYPASAPDLFFISKLSDSSWQSLLDLKGSAPKLSIDHDTYMTNLEQLRDEDIANHLGRELLKVSFIRELKVAKMKAMLLLLMLSLFLTLVDHAVLIRL